MRKNHKQIIDWKKTKRSVGRPNFFKDSAKKRIQKERNKAPVFKTKVYLGRQYESWMVNKEELGETHADLPKILLDRYTCLYYLQ